MFQTQKELINNLYYKGYNPNVILCNLKQDRIIRFCSRNDQIASPKNGIYVINFTLEDRRILTKKNIAYLILDKWLSNSLLIVKIRKLMK